MKVDANPEILGGGCAVKGNQRSETGGSEFSAILEESLEDMACTGDISSKDDQVQVGGISRSQLDIFGKAETSAVDQVENCLNILSDYQEKLGNPDVTLKELSPLVEQMTQEGERLTSILDSLAENDSLKGIANETLVLSSLESIKFNRGDYNPL